MIEEAKAKLEELAPKEAEAWNQVREFEQTDAWKTLNRQHDKLTQEWCELHRKVEALRILCPTTPQPTN